jgi:hypothetical protein
MKKKPSTKKKNNTILDHILNYIFCDKIKSKGPLEYSHYNQQQVHFSFRKSKGVLLVSLI